MKLIITFFILSHSFLASFAQSVMVLDDVDGTYYLSNEERGIKKKLGQLVENNGTRMLALAACEKCPPAIYTYQEQDSKRLGVPVFFNTMGLYVIAYDKDSFVTVWVTNQLGKGVWSSFNFSNFYSKDASKAKQMTKNKIETYAIEISKK